MIIVILIQMVEIHIIDYLIIIQIPRDVILTNLEFLKYFRK